MHMWKIKNEKGIASIIVTLIMIIVISLIVVGVSQVSINEQKAATEKALNSAAYFAAQSAINNAIKTPPASGSTCNNASGSKYANYSLNSSSIKVICTKVTGNSTVFQVPPIAVGTSQVADVVSSATITNITFNWSNPNTTDGNSCPSSSAINSIGNSMTNNLPAFGSWPANCPSVLLIDLVNPSSLTLTKFQTDDVSTGNLNLVLVPTNATSTATTTFPATASNNGTRSSVVAASCGNSGGTASQCSVSLKMVDTSSPVVSVPATSEYYVRITSLYSGTNMSMSNLGSGSTIINQTTYDATAVAGTVSQRLVAVITKPSSTFTTTLGGLLPQFALQSGGDICKRYYNKGSGNDLGYDSITYNGTTHCSGI